jgi:hypothetical protein
MEWAMLITRNPANQDHQITASQIQESQNQQPHISVSQVPDGLMQDPNVEVNQAQLDSYLQGL